MFANLSHESQENTQSHVQLVQISHSSTGYSDRWAGHWRAACYISTARSSSWKVHWTKYSDLREENKSRTKELPNEKVRRNLPTSVYIRWTNQGIFRWAGHVERIKWMRNSYGISLAKAKGKKLHRQLQAYGGWYKIITNITRECEAESYGSGRGPTVG